MSVVKPKEAKAIINSLVGGVVPKLGIQHITVGRKKEVAAILASLEDVKNGHSMVKFWMGEFGSGKSFLLHLITTVALKEKFVVSNADFTPSTRLYANDGKALGLYKSIIDNLSTQTKQGGGALSALLEKWIEQILQKAAAQNGIELVNIRDIKYLSLIGDLIIKTTSELTDVGAFDFGQVVIKYYEGYITENEQLRKAALKWLKGEYTTKTEARQELGVREIINDNNYYDMLKNFSQLFIRIGYSGFMINLDEAINLYKISNSAARAKNYEKLLHIYNDCFQGKVEHLFFNFAGTKLSITDTRKGVFSYDALKTRLSFNEHETKEIRDFAQPIIKIFPLDHNEIFVLLEKLKIIYDQNYKCNISINDTEIKKFIEEMVNRPGADKFLTPRELVKGFLNILNILRQNPSVSKTELFKSTEVDQPTSLESSLDGIKEF